MKQVLFNLPFLCGGKRSSSQGRNIWAPEGREAWPAMPATRPSIVSIAEGGRDSRQWRAAEADRPTDRRDGSNFSPGRGDAERTLESLLWMKSKLKACSCSALSYLRACGKFTQLCRLQCLFGLVDRRRLRRTKLTTTRHVGFAIGKNVYGKVILVRAISQACLCGPCCKQILGNV